MRRKGGQQSPGRTVTPPKNVSTPAPPQVVWNGLAGSSREISEHPRRVIRLTGHDSVLTERYGKFRVICGCNWASDYATPEEVERDHDAHLAAVDRGDE